MRLLLTSDWQCDVSNLDLCAIAHKELLAAIKKHKPDAVINAGDLKEQYSPMHVPVATFWVRATKEIVATGVPYYVLLGNHDRVSQSLDSQNWMSVLRAAGAKTVTKPKVVELKGDVLCFLPFTADKKQEIEWADQLADEAVGCACARVLLFHTEVLGANMNSSGTKTHGADPHDLRFHDYNACFGGHIHGHQRIGGNSWYIGSPFCQSWNEANEPKGFLLVDIQHDAKVQQIRTSIPGWYDAQYLSTHKLEPEPGAYIRSKVEVTSKKISHQLREEEKRLLAKYADANLYVIPTIKPAETLDVQISGSTDKERVEQYVVATFPDGARFHADKGVRYLLSKLKLVAPGALGRRLRVLKVKGTNILPFEKVSIPLDKQGLVLVKGVNADWPKRSNGAGKSSLLRLLQIIWFGESSTGQKNDDWANERTEGAAIGHLFLKNYRGQEIEIIRGRRPHKLILRVDGKDESLGLTGKRKGETQTEIENITGFDLSLLLNSVYIDQTMTNGMLFGTQKYRMDLLSRLCNLERYDEAVKLVQKDALEAAKEHARVLAECDSLKADEEELQSEYDEVTEELVKQTEWKAKADQARAALKSLRKQQTSLLAEADRFKVLAEKLDRYREEMESAKSSLNDMQLVIRQNEEEAARAIRFIKEKKCRTCGQSTEAIGQSLGTGIAKSLAAARESFAALNARKELIYAKELKLSSKVGDYELEAEHVIAKINQAKQLLKTVEQGEAEEAERRTRLTAKKASIQASLTAKKRIAKGSIQYLKELEEDQELLTYCQKAFHRSGMPMYLAASLCPILNKAAEEYAEIFCESKLNITFAVVDQEFIITIINPHGSESSKSQSTGEAAMAAIITAFATSDSAPQTNIRILDEPGHGLDSEGAKDFARGIVKLKESGRFGTILLTTHSGIIESALLGEAKVWTVTKKNGISTLSR